MSNWKEEWRGPALQSVKTFWLKFKKEYTNRPSSQDSYEYFPSQLAGEPAEMDEYDRILQEFKDKANQGRQEKDDYEKYCSEGAYEIPGLTSLQWWLLDEQQKRFPVLSKFALEVLSIPAMSDEPERVFSGARRTVSWERMSLGEDNVERIACIKSWYRSSILKVLI
jgi:hypothetical protein